MKCGDSEQCSKVHDLLADVAHNHVFIKVRRNLSSSMYYFFYVLYVILYDMLNNIFFICLYSGK